MIAHGKMLYVFTKYGELWNKLNEYTMDITCMQLMMDELNDSDVKDNFCLDSACLARRMCDMIADKRW